LTGIEPWWADGHQVTLALSGARRRIFIRRLGHGTKPHITLLHGFPSSSHDWAKIAPALADDHTLLLPDFLGFGASEKPRDHVYSIHEQADLVHALWTKEGITTTRVVAHDYAVSVTQELLARRAEGAGPTEITHVQLLNGGLYPSLHRPEPVQAALLDPEQGPKLGPLMNEELIVNALKPTFAPGYDHTADATDIWRSMSRDDGQLNSHLLIRYILDRRTHEQRWVSVLEDTDVPRAFTWGMLDPVSGAHMAERIRERLPDAPFTALEDVGHWPPLEAPDRVAAAILNP
jgi:pimeloyl-ACP methyl ester carboxylesterase